MRILVATDGSRAASAAVKFAGRLAGSDPGAEVVILTVHSNGSRGRSKNAGDTPSEGDRVLQSAARQFGERGARPRFQAVSARRPDEVPETISREADRLDADVIVVGSEGRDSLQEWILGGTALRLIYVARRPVTVVRPPRRRARA